MLSYVALRCLMMAYVLKELLATRVSGLSYVVLCYILISCVDLGCGMLYYVRLRFSSSRWPHVFCFVLRRPMLPYVVLCYLMLSYIVVCFQVLTYVARC